jgi:hypothetical protein
VGPRKLMGIVLRREGAGAKVALVTRTRAQLGSSIIKIASYVIILKTPLYEEGRIHGEQ